jgi:hypothetical protein
MRTALALAAVAAARLSFSNFAVDAYVLGGRLSSPQTTATRTTTTTSRTSRVLQGVLDDKSMDAEIRREVCCVQKIASKMTRNS